MARTRFLRVVRLGLLAGATVALTGLLALVGCAEEETPDTPIGVPPHVEASFVGTAACADCHPTETEAWLGSHHDLAMQEATADTVLGDFGAEPFEHFGEKTRFVPEGERFRVVVSGPDGEAEREIAYTFGVEPLQQLLVPMPGGRLQVLGVAWDSRDASCGGQRWFHLHPDEALPPGDVLHWASPAQNWNSMCAACHSTALRKGYSLETDAYETTWAELDVACEACHGPGSAHLAWAQDGVGTAFGLVVDLSNDAEWVFGGGAPIARRATPRTSHAELEACAPCHSRRSALRAEPSWGEPFLDGYRPALLAEDLYQADGQILDEVYVWGSFVQSRMHAAGVTCSDCHEPHALALPDPPEATCNTCHRPEIFASPEHHHHPEGSAGASCVACHMPARTYMGVDERHDHSFRVPRPDLSKQIGTSNACTDCHLDRNAAWASAAARSWWGAPKRGHFGTVLDAGRGGRPEVDPLLVALAGDIAVPGIARATALTLLRMPTALPGAEALAAGLRDPDPLVRLGALGVTDRIDPHSRLALVKPLLRDSLRAVRIEAARTLSDVPASAWGPGERDALRSGLAEYREAQLAQAERPASHLNLGLLAMRTGDRDGARRAYEQALRLGPWFVPAAVNLADLERTEGREAQAETVLRRGLEHAPDSPELLHSLGLALVRQQRTEEGLAELGRAADLAPEQPRYAYVYAVGLHSLRRPEEARAVIEHALSLHPHDPELRQARATFQQE